MPCVLVKMRQPSISSPTAVLTWAFGQGYSPSEFEGYGIPRKERASLLEEGIEVIRGMWTQDPFSYEGKHYNLKEHQSRTQTRSNTASTTLDWRRTAQSGRESSPNGLPFPRHLMTRMPRRSYDDTLLRTHGRDPKDFHAAQLRWAHVAPTRDQAWENVQEHLHYMLTWYGRWLAEAKDFAGAEKFAQLPPAIRAAQRC